MFTVVCVTYQSRGSGGDGGRNDSETAARALRVIHVILFEVYVGGLCSSSRRQNEQNKQSNIYLSKWNVLPAGETRQVTADQGARTGAGYMGGQKMGELSIPSGRQTPSPFS